MTPAPRPFARAYFELHANADITNVAAENLTYMRLLWSRQAFLSRNAQRLTNALQVAVRRKNIGF